MENADFYCTIYSFEALYMSAPDSSCNSGYTNWSYRDLHTSLLRPTPTIDKPRTTVSLNVGSDVFKIVKHTQNRKAQVDQLAMQQSDPLKLLNKKKKEARKQMETDICKNTNNCVGKIVVHEVSSTRPTWDI